MNKKLTLLVLVIIALAWIIPIFTKPIMAEEAISIYQNSWIDHNKNGKIDVYEDPNSPIERRVKDLLSRMTLDEKIGQVLQYPEPYLRKGIKFSSENAKKLIYEYKVGSILKNLVGSTPEEWAKISNEIQRIALEDTRLGIPIIIGDDIIHGYAQLIGATILPVRIGQAATWDPELIQKAASATAKESRSVGTHWAFAPTLSVVRDPRWGRTEETFGEDPYLVLKMGVAIVKGFQGKALNSSTTILAGPKHFAGDGESIGGRNADPIDVSDRTLREVILPPFKAAVEAGAGNIMAAHHALNGIPCHANRKLLTEILRKEWGFEGFVVSDWTDIERLYDNFNIAATIGEAGKQAIEAGVDMDMVGSWRKDPAFGKPLLQLVMEGKVPEKTINRSAGRILRAKFQLGLFEHPFVDPEGVTGIINSKKNRELALKVARESIVLLNNEGDLLPLNKTKINSIAVIGPNADNPPHQLGDWTAKEPREIISTVLDGIKNKVSPETEILYGEGCTLVGDSKEGFDEAIKIAKKSDVAIVVVGGASERYHQGFRTCGEGQDRARLDLPGVQEELVKAIYATGVKVVVVLINGRPLTINWIVENIPAILEAWYPGEEGGNAIADVIFGDYNPGGKLPITFPRFVGQLPIYYNLERGRSMGYVASEPFNKFVPLFPFGHGLSYTEFEYRELEIKPKKVTSPSGKFAVSLKVKNIGECEGDEVIQLYIKDNVANVVRPIKELKGFKRVTLNPGEEKIITFKLQAKQLAFHDKNKDLVVEPGNFEVMVGSSSIEIKLKDSFEVVGKKHKVIPHPVLFTSITVEP